MNNNLNLGDWGINNVFFYFLLVMFLGLCIRLLTILMKIIDRDYKNLKSWKFFKNSFFGRCGNKLKEKGDRWLTYILGLFELSIYPVLMITENWSFIGAWLAFKAVSQWKKWKKDRNCFIRFLIGNILVLLSAYFVLQRFIILKK